MEQDNPTTTSPPSKSCSFEAAVSALFSPLHQSQTKEAIQAAAARRIHTVADMQGYWNQIVKANNKHTINKKNCPRRIIHITGTKGKGSTACFCDSILRTHGYTTGLCTSPHLVDIRERIRIHGQPISQNDFALVYWTIRQALEREAEEDSIEKEGISSAVPYSSDDIHNDDTTSSETIPPPPRIPGYFRMLTLMACYAFEYLYQPDVVILEVGMGGRYDATNFWPPPCSNDTTIQRVCGVTLLDLDHVRILGHTLEEIAWEKGGIFRVRNNNQRECQQATAGSMLMTTPKPTPKAQKLDCHDNDKKGGNVTTSLINSIPGSRKKKTDSSISGSDSQHGGPPPATAMTTATSDCDFFVLDSNNEKEGVIPMLKACARNEGQNGGKINLVDASGKAIRQLQSEQNNKNQKAENDTATSSVFLGLAGDHQYGNAMLAVELCRRVTEDNSHKSRSVTNCHQPSPIHLADVKTLQGLTTASWPGRCQTLQRKTKNDTAMHYRLDGAHTLQSLHATVQWFQSQQEQPRRQTVLVFSCSHERNPVELLESLQQIPFEMVYFAKPDSHRPSPIPVPSADELLTKNHCASSKSPKGHTMTSQTKQENHLAWSDTLGIVWQHLMHETTEGSSSVRCGLSASQVVEELTRSESNSDVDVLVTGSLYLVGSFLSALEWEERSYASKVCIP